MTKCDLLGVLFQKTKTVGCGKVTCFVVLSKARSLSKQMAYFLIPRSIARTVIMTKCNLLGVLFQKTKTVGCGKVTCFVVLSKARSLSKQMAYFLIPRSIAKTVNAIDRS